MKTIILGISLISSCIFAQDITRLEKWNNSVAIKTQSPTYISKANIFSQCVRDLIEKGGQGVEGFDRVISFLDQVLVENTTQTLTELNESVEDCQSLKRSIGTEGNITG